MDALDTTEADRQAVTGGDFRLADLGDAHPILRDAAILPTRPLEEFVNLLRLWLDNLLPGGVVWDHPRVGKTQAIRYVTGRAEALLGAPIPVTLHSSWDPTHTSLTENRFFGDLLRELGYPLLGTGTAAIKRQRVIDVMVERTRSAGEHRYLLFVDEAQWMATVQLRYLMDLHNQLKIADVRLITVLVGQPELCEMKTNLRGARQNHLLGRFMTAVHRYEGVTGRPDFARLCRALDDQSEFPIGSGVSFTRYFVPQAFDAGWRLEANATLVWETLEAVRLTESIPSCPELPMQALAALIRWLLQSLAAEDAATLELERAAIEEAIYRVALPQIADHAHQYQRAPVG